MARIYDLQVSAVYDWLERIDRNLFSGRKSRGCFGFRMKRLSVSLCLLGQSGCQDRYFA